MEQDMLEVMQSIATELDFMDDELFDAIFENLVEPTKVIRSPVVRTARTNAQSGNPKAYALAAQLIRNIPEVMQKFAHSVRLASLQSSTLDPAQFFRNLLGAGKATESSLADHVYDLILELNAISPQVLMLVLPQLEDQLKLEERDERLTVTRLLSKIFADKACCC